MGDSLQWKALHTLASPIVRIKAFRLAAALGLRSHDREDLEQELWLELLARHREPPADPFPLNGAPHLGEELNQIATALVRSWALGRRVRPAPERYLTPSLSDALTAAESHDDTGLRDLSLDMVSILAQLPVADRRLCEAFMSHGADACGADLERRLAPLRHDFAALDLHEYL